MKKAFTLIELLVVIAIIAILAAILFPVFAQAKAAAKATASLSNAKQIALSIIMYEGDADDMFPIAQANGTVPGSSYQIGTLVQQVTPWTKLMQPYQKNVDIFRDPTAAAIGTIAPFTAQDSVIVAPQYGYNFAYLNQAGTTGFTPYSSTSAANPADTVVLTSRAGYNETTGFQKITPAPGWDASTSYLAFPPAGSGLGVSYNWGSGGVFATTIPTVQAGRFSAGVSAHVADMVIVAFVDGHAKRLRPDTLAGGTGYRYSASGANPTLTANVTVPLNGSTNFDKFIWDLQ